MPEAPEPGKKLNDSGTRYAHLTDLLEEWETGLVVLQGRPVNPATIKAWTLKVTQLESGITLLRGHIDAMASYDHHGKYQLGKKIDALEVRK